MRIVTEKTKSVLTMLKFRKEGNMQKRHNKRGNLIRTTSTEQELNIPVVGDRVPLLLRIPLMTRRKFLNYSLKGGAGAVVLSLLGGLTGVLVRPKTAEAHPARGQITRLDPPGNDGSRPGAGLINPRNTSGALTAPPYHVFQTPTDVVAGQILSVGLDVTYIQGPGNQATAVQRDEV